MIEGFRSTIVARRHSTLQTARLSVVTYYAVSVNPAAAPPEMEALTFTGPLTGDKV